MHPDLGERPESTSQSRLLANKYRDPEALEKAYLELQTHSNRQFERIREIEDRMARVEQTKAPEHDPLEALTEVGLPVDDMRLLIQRELDARLNPIFEQQRARQQVSQVYPDFDKREDEVAQWLSQDRDLASRYGRMFQADPAGAMEWAMASYERAMGDGDRSRRNPDIGLPPTNSGTSRSGSEIANEEQLQKELELARQSGQWARYVAMRLDQTTPGTHYEGLGGPNR